MKRKTAKLPSKATPDRRPNNSPLTEARFAALHRQCIEAHAATVQPHTLYPVIIELAGEGESRWKPATLPLFKHAKRLVGLSVRIGPIGPAYLVWAMAQSGPVSFTNAWPRAALGAEIIEPPPFGVWILNSGADADFSPEQRSAVKLLQFAARAAVEVLPVDTQFSANARSGFPVEYDAARWLEFLVESAPDCDVREIDKGVGAKVRCLLRDVFDETAAALERLEVASDDRPAKSKGWKPCAKTMKIIRLMQEGLSNEAVMDRLGVEFCKSIKNIRTIRKRAKASKMLNVDKPARA
jgi:hypothetical protein